MPRSEFNTRQVRHKALCCPPLEQTMKNYTNSASIAKCPWCPDQHGTIGFLVLLIHDNDGHDLKKREREKNKKA